MNKYDLYQKMPIPVQNLMVSTKGLINYKSRYGREYYSYKDFLYEYNSWNYCKKKEYQNKELIKFIRFVYDNNKFYKNLYDANNVILDEIKSVEDIHKLPIVDKELIRSNISTAVSDIKGPFVEGHTGGTTGKSLVVKFTEKDMMRRMATLDYFKEINGFYNLKMKRASFTGQKIVPIENHKNVFWRYNSSCKQMLYSSFHVNEENLPYYVKSLNEYRPDSIDGFFTAILDIANYIDRKNINLDFTPVGIFPTSETITDSGREVIERVFKCKLYNQYASSEGAPFVYECKNGRLHVEMSSGVIEKYNEDNEILVTSFTTHGTPLIRYKIGDTMVFNNHNNSCSCGIESDLVKSISGRSLDFLYSSNGSKINSGNIANLFKNLDDTVIKSQWIQNNINEINVNLVVTDDFYSKRNDIKLKDEFYQRFGNSSKIILNFVDDIPREPNGKFRFVKNNVDMNKDI